MPISETLVKAIAVTAELTGTELSAAGARVLADDVSRYPEAQVLGALTRCRKELRGRLTVADIIARLDDGRPNPEEAWAMIPRSEAATAVWTYEMCAAWSVALPLLREGEVIPARMAFLEAYRAAILFARDTCLPVHWSATLGWDIGGREAPLIDAVEKGRLTARHVAGLLPYRDDPNPRIAALLADAVRALPKPAAGKART